MFMFSVRLSRKRVLAGVTAAALVVGVGVLGVRAISGGETMTSAVSAGDSEKVKIKKITLKTGDERLEFIRSFGWEVETDPVEVVEAVVPEEFDDVYTQYNSVQKKQGFDLEKYAGKRFKRYSYIVTNHPGTDGEVRINLMMYGDRLIGGDVSLMRSDGFVHGFTPQ